MSHEPGAADEYRRRQLIPYLGNKRSLLPRLEALFAEIVPDPRGLRFLDPFAGSGSVSRLARTMGFSVFANDWEPYSEAINRCWLVLRPADLERACAGAGGIATLYADWNSMHPQAVPEAVPENARGEPYMARWYAPRLTHSPDLDGERLFYTAENAAFLDRVRTRIGRECAADGPGSDSAVLRTALMGSLLLEAATHANTSGVFKAYHRGFGGHGRDALGRIMGRMVLEPPLLVDAEPAAVERKDAAAFCAGRAVDLAYLDPPYNQHQYGSNYHLLNTLVRWDGEPMPLDRGKDGRLARKAGISALWRETRSEFCMRTTAESALRELLDSIDAGLLVVSWNGEGCVDGGAMAELLAPRGALEVRALDYHTYRGGRQSAGRKVLNREYLYLLDTRRPPTAVSAVHRLLAEYGERDAALRGRYDPARLAERFQVEPDGLVFACSDAGRNASRAATGAAHGADCARYRFPLVQARFPGQGAAEALDSMPVEVRAEFLVALAECSCADVAAELRALEALVARKNAAGSAARKDALRFLRKLAHRKHAAAFAGFLASFRAKAKEHETFLAGLDELESLAGKRFSYSALPGAPLGRAPGP